MVNPARQVTFALVEQGETGGLIDTGGSCSIRLRLTDTQSPDPYGVPSPAVDSAFTIGSQPSYAFTTQFVGDCTADFKCGPLGQPYQLEVDVAQPGSGGSWFAGGGDWSVAAGDRNLAHSADLCYTGVLGLPTPPVFPYIVTLPQTCAQPKSVTITVTYTYLGQQQTADAGSPTNNPGSPATTTTTTTIPSTTTTSKGSPSTTAGASPLAVGWSLGATALWRVVAYLRRKRRARSR
jgi:hypothetical protein